MVSQFLKVTGKTYKAYQFITFTLPFFTELNKQWYQYVEGKNVKVLPSNISERFTPRALAYWLAGEAWFHKGNGAVV